MTNIEKANEPGAVAVPDDFDGYDDGLGSVIEQFGLATPRIVTNMKFGHAAFTDELTGEVIETLHLTILGSTVSRAWWEDDKTLKGVGPDCRSFDSIVPDPQSPKLQAETCAACPHSQWGEANERPACRQSVQILAFDHDQEGVRVLRISGTSLKRFDKFVSAFRTTKKLGKAFEWVIEIGTEIVPDDYDKHQELVFRLDRRMEAEQTHQLLVLREKVGWKAQLQSDLERDEPSADPFSDEAIAKDKVADPDDPEREF